MIGKNILIINIIIISFDTLLIIIGRPKRKLYDVEEAKSTKKGTKPRVIVRVS